MNILLGVTGGIAAYKSVELVRQLRDEGHDVRVVMTQHAQAFVTPFCFQAISGNPVYAELMDESIGNGMRHIELARWAEIILIAPASANTIAKIAHGLADDLLTTLCLASNAKLCIVPAMNKQMWENKTLQENIKKITANNVILIGPESGEQACGDVGVGRMSEPNHIVDELKLLFSENPFWKNRKVMITAGPTHEKIDPIRFISNKSTGKMGYALAEAVAQMGADVILISGPTNLSVPNNVKVVKVISAQEMYDAVFQNIKDVNIFIGAAAVANYHLENPATQKIKSSEKKITLSLIANPDIIHSVAALENKPFVVGFAAETNNLIESAQLKLVNKKLDMIIANDVSGNKGMGSEKNAVTVIDRLGKNIFLPENIKKALAKQMLAEIQDSVKNVVSR